MLSHDERRLIPCSSSPPYLLQLTLQIGSSSCIKILLPSFYTSWLLPIEPPEQPFLSTLTTNTQICYPSIFTCQYLFFKCYPQSYTFCRYPQSSTLWPIPCSYLLILFIFIRSQSLPYLLYLSLFYYLWRSFLLPMKIYLSQINLIWRLSFCTSR